MTWQQAAEAAERGAWQRVARGVYDVAGQVELPLSDPHDRARRRAAVLGPLALPGAVITGICALVMHGVQGAPASIASEVAFPDGTSRRSTAPVRVRRCGVAEWTTVAGFRCATVSDALGQAVIGVSRRHAVALMDSALHLGRLTQLDLEQAHAAVRHRRGVASTHSWWHETDMRSESPAETWARLACRDAGYPPDVVQLRVLSRDGRFLARVDLGWRLPDGRWLLVEIDGRTVHEAPGALFSDRTRQNSIATASTLVRRYTGAEAWSGSFVPQVGALLVASGWRPGSPTPTELRL